MTLADLVLQRLENQQIAATKRSSPVEVVDWLGAMQAQEYALSKWSIGLRLPPGFQDADVEKLFNEGAILRTHLLRPTWHFVTPADIRWMLVLTAPRVHAANAFMYRSTGLDAAVFKRSNNMLIKALEGGKQLTRSALQTALARENIVADGFRLSYLMMYAELEGLLCSGARQGNQFTYALLDERAPAVKPLDRTDALAELTRRYFASRGPATLQDYVWWSGLTVKDAKAGIAMLPDQFEQAVLDGKTYYFWPVEVPNHPNRQTSFLMPDYDEYGIAYKDRSALINPANQHKMAPAGTPVYNRMIIIDGRIEGTWQRTVKNKAVAVETVPFTPLNAAKQRALDQAVAAYRAFVGKSDLFSI